MAFNRAAEPPRGQSWTAGDVESGMWLPDLAGNAQIVGIGVNHFSSAMTQLAISQVQSLSIGVVYVEMTDKRNLLGRMERGDRLTIGDLHQTFDQRDGIADVVLAAQAMGIPVVGVDDSTALEHLITQHGPSGRDPWPESKYRAAFFGEGRARTLTMARRIFRDQQERVRRTGEAPRGLWAGGASHLVDIFTVDGAASPAQGLGRVLDPGIGAHLRANGVFAVDILSLGDIMTSEFMNFGARLTDEQRQETFVLSSTQNAALFGLHSPELLISGELADAINSPPSRQMPPRVARLIENETAGREPAMSRLRYQYFMRGGNAAGAATAAAQAVKFGDHNFLVEAGRAHMLAAALDGNPTQLARGIAVLELAVTRGVTGAGRIAAGHFESLVDAFDAELGDELLTRAERSAHAALVSERDTARAHSLLRDGRGPDDPDGLAPGSNSPEPAPITDPSPHGSARTAPEVPDDPTQRRPESARRPRDGRVRRYPPEVSRDDVQDDPPVLKPSTPVSGVDLKGRRPRPERSGGASYAARRERVAPSDCATTAQVVVRSERSPRDSRRERPNDGSLNGR